MAKPPEESRPIRRRRREEHDKRPPTSDDETPLAPVDGRTTIGDDVTEAIEPPPFSTRAAPSERERENKETTATPDEEALEAPAIDDREPAALGEKESPGAPVIAEDPSAREVFPPDSRQLYTPTTVFPNRAVCQLLVKYPGTPAGKWWRGTGSLIGTRHVLTAGHVLCKLSEGGWAKFINVIPGRDGATVWPYGSELLIWPNFKQRSVTGWSEDEDIDYDYGLITLNRGFSLDAFGLLYLSDDTLESTNAHLIGYPGDLPGNSPDKGYRQYGVPTGGAVTDYDSTLVYYAMDTKPGQSGAGVYRWWNGKRAIFAVHGGQYDSDENRAARITKARHDKIRGWQSQDA